MSKWILFLVLFTAVGGFASAQNAAKVGSKAPSITIDEWLKGEPVTEFKKGTVYLMEFWGTWCEPCVENIPHLSELQKKYGASGFVVIGVATHETKDRNHLLEFMKSRGDDMQYTVAYDKDLSMEKDWDTGGGNDFRLPVCFLIDKNGTVVFCGHPADSELEGWIESTLGKK